MIEPKPFASLSSGLLARKGSAKPAMRPQGFGQMGAGIEDLGWNDMGYSPPAPQEPEPFEESEARAPSPIAALTPMNSAVEAIEAEDEEFEPAPPIVEQQRAAIEASFAEPIGAQADVDRIVHATKSKKTMALDPPEAADEPEIVAEMPEPVVPEPVASEPEVVQPVPSAVVKLPAKVQAKAQRVARSKAAFTLRLDTDRHLKLRLACAVTGRSAQQFVTEALDRLLETRPEIEALAGQLPAKAGKPR